MVTPQAAHISGALVGNEKEITLTTAIIVSGAPASGKSVLSDWLAKETGLQLLSKDFIKEALFDEFGCDTREESKVLGKASFEMLLDRCRHLALARRSFIVESAFRSSDGLMLSAAFQGLNLIHVCCIAPEAEIIERFEQRALSGERHPGHLDSGNVMELSSMLKGGTFDIVIPGAIRIDVNTTDFDSYMYTAAREKILSAYAN